MEKAQRALGGAATDLREDLARSGTMPIRSGHLQNAATRVWLGDLRRNRAAVVSDTVYARRKYFNPQFEFNRGVNAMAGGRWFDPYISGGKRGLVRDKFVARLRDAVKS